MSRLEQIASGELLHNPAKRFLEPKNNYTVKTIKNDDGEDEEVKVFKDMSFVYSKKNESDEYENFNVELPIEFAVLNPQFISFKGWNETESVRYWSNEIDSFNDNDLISIRNKEGIVFEFTLAQKNEKVPGTKNSTDAAKEIQGKLKQLGVKQYSSIYAAVKTDDGEFETINFQIKGSSLSGEMEPKRKAFKGTDAAFEKEIKRIRENQVGFWAFNKKHGTNKFKYPTSGKMITNYVQINDFIKVKGEIGTYGILNFTIGDVISKEDNEKLDVLHAELTAYLKYYTTKPELVKDEATPFVEDGGSDDI